MIICLKCLETENAVVSVPARRPSWECVQQSSVGGAQRCGRSTAVWAEHSGVGGAQRCGQGTQGWSRRETRKDQKSTTTFGCIDLRLYNHAFKISFFLFGLKTSIYLGGHIYFPWYTYQNGRSEG